MNDVNVRAWQPEDVSAMREIWNEVVRAGAAFPQENELTEKDAADFFAGQIGRASCRERV